MGGLSWVHWLVVLAIVILIFGTKRLKNVGSDLGEAIKGFKKGVADDDAPRADAPARQDEPPARLSDDSRGADPVRNDPARSESVHGRPVPADPTQTERDPADGRDDATSGDRKPPRDR